MTLEEIRLLDTPALRDAVDANLERDPNAIALDKRLPHAALVATQVKYLQRARRKLPTYFAARAIIPSLAFEQASSEAAAACKTWSGNRCIDLTCGLGVDTLALSKAFGEVISIERDAVVAETARINFARMGATNITVVNDTAEVFLQRFAAEGRTADLIYADPDRRSDTGRKLVLLEECRPDIRALLPLLRRLTPRIAVKLSPLFDVAEAFRIFGDRSRVRAISQHGECKELLVETGDAVTVPAVGVTVLDRGEAWFATGETPPDRPVGPFEPPYRYLLMPDVALRLCRPGRRLPVSQPAARPAAAGTTFRDPLLRTVRPRPAQTLPARTGHPLGRTPPPPLSARSRRPGPPPRHPGGRRSLPGLHRNRRHALGNRIKNDNFVRNGDRTGPATRILP